MDTSTVHCSTRESDIKRDSLSYVLFCLVEDTVLYTFISRCHVVLESKSKNLDLQ